MRKLLIFALLFLSLSSLWADSGSAVLKQAVFDGDGNIVAWKAVSNADINGKNAYVIAHGLNDIHNAKWVENIAESFNKQSSADTVILSVDWDKDSAGPLASTRINSNIESLAKELSGVKIETAVGHSYGTHLLAGVIAQTDAKINNFVALDPAEESLTFTGTSSDWSEAVAKTNVEVYKSSVFLGSEVPLGDHNFLLAKPGDISPQSLGGDWGGANPLAGENSNHSLATSWYNKIIAETGKSSGWFSDQVKAGVTTTDAEGKTTTEVAATGTGTWTGVVNTAKYDTLDYLLPASKATGDWGDVFTAMGLATENWEGTVLDPSHKKNFDSQFEVSTYTDEDGNEWKYDPKTGKTYKNGVEYTGNIDLGSDWDDSSSSGNMNSITDYLDNIMDDLENAGKDVLDDALDIFKDTWKNTTGSIWDKLKSGVKGGLQGAINSVKSNAQILIKKYLSLESLETLANFGLQKLLSLNPTLEKIFNKLGLNNINNIIGLCKDIFNMVKGLLNGGSFLSLLKSSEFLKNVLSNAIKWGIDLLKNLLCNLLSKWLSGLADWAEGFVNKVLGKFGIKVSIDFQKLLNKGIDEALNAGTKWVKAKVDSWLKPADKQNSSNPPPAGGTNVFDQQILVNP